jgi:hypothetical protein
VKFFKNIQHLDLKMSTKLCYFFQQGNKGSNCAFIHNSITIESDSSSLANSENYSDND